MTIKSKKDKDLIVILYVCLLFAVIITPFVLIGNYYSKVMDKQLESRVIESIPIIIQGKIIRYDRNNRFDGSCIVYYKLGNEEYELESFELYKERWVIGDKVNILFNSKNLEEFFIEECSVAKR